MKKCKQCGKYRGQIEALNGVIRTYTGAPVTPGMERRFKRYQEGQIDSQVAIGEAEDAREEWRKLALDRWDRIEVLERVPRWIRRLFRAV